MSVKRNLVSRLTRTRLLFPLLLIVLLLPAVYFYATRPKETAAWWNESWVYRKRIDISNPGGSDLTDFQVSFTLDTTDTSKFQSNCADLRITGVDGNLLPFWIEENNPGCGDANTKVWVKLPSIPSSGTYIYAYYGNPSASVSSDHDGEKVFEFFDDFSGTSLDTTKWEEMNSSQGSTTLNSGTATVNSNGLDWWGTTDTSYSIVNKTNLGTAYTAEAKIDGIDLTGSYPRYFGLRNSSATNSKMFVFLGDSDESHISNVYRETTGGSAGYYGDNTGQIIGSAPYHNKFTTNGNTVSAYHQETLTFSRTVTDWNLTQIAFTDTETGSGGTVIDWVIARKFSSTQPTTTTQSEEIGPGPIAYWKFDEGTGSTVNDSSSNAHHGTISGATWQTEDQCVSGKCIYFDGTNDYIDTNWDFDMGSDISTSFSIWIKPVTVDTGGKVKTILGKIDYQYALYQLDQKLYFQAWTSAGVNTIAYQTNNILNTNQWTQVTFIHNGSEHKSYFYINGTLYGSANDTAGTFKNVSESMKIGRGYGWGGSTTPYFNGFIDELKVFPYTLTEDQIKTEYNLGAAAVMGTGPLVTLPSNGTLEDSLVAHWSFDEQAGQTVHDRVGGNDGTRGADANTGSDDPTWKPASECKVNGCLGFDGVDDFSFISLPSIPHFSLSAWIYLPTLPVGEKQYFSAYQDSVGLTSYGNKFMFYDGGILTSNTTPIAQKWYFVTITSDGTTKKIYVDGKLEKTQAYTRGISPGAARLGSFVSGGRFINCLLDEVKIYNTALTSEQIRQDMNAGASVSYSVGQDEADDLTDGAGDPPVAEWRFDEKQGATAYDTSGNENNGTVNGATWKSAARCHQGACLEFDGVDDYVNVGDKEQLTFSGDFTVEFWMYPKDGGVDFFWGGVSKAGLNGSREWEIGFDPTQGDAVRFLLGNSSGSWATDLIRGAGLPRNTWHHITARLSNGQASIFINGVQSGPSVAYGSSLLNTVSPIYVGNVYQYTSQSSFNGLIDHVKIYDYARTPAQIAYDYNRGEPVAHWKMDECQGSTIHDSSNNSNHGTLTVTTTGGNTNGIGTCTTSTSAWGSGSSGKFGASLYLDGDNDKIVVTDNDTLDGFTGMSVFLWAKPSISSVKEIIIKHNTGTSDINWELYQNGNNLGARINGTSGTCTSTGDKFTTNTWHHIGMVWTGTEIKIYIDGVLSSNSCSRITSLPNTAGNLSIGSYESGSYSFNGQLDDIRIYNYALSETQVKKIMNEGSALRFGD